MSRESAENPTASPISFRVSAEQRARIEAEAKRWDMTVSDLVRYATFQVCGIDDDEVRAAAFKARITALPR